VQQEAPCGKEEHSVPGFFLRGQEVLGSKKAVMLRVCNIFTWLV